MLFTPNITDYSVFRHIKPLSFQNVIFIKRRRNVNNTNKKLLFKNKKYRDYCLFIIGINISWRISDILKICWNDVYDFELQKFREHLVLREQKTGKLNCIALNESCQKALTLQMKYKYPSFQDDYIFYSKIMLRNIFHEIGHGI